MPTVTMRTLIKFGEKGLVLTLPKAWVDYYEVKPGDKVSVIADGELIVRLMQEVNREQQQRVPRGHTQASL